MSYNKEIFINIIKNDILIKYDLYIINIFIKYIMSIRPLEEKEFDEEMKIRQFKKLGNSYGIHVFILEEAFMAYLAQYKKEMTEEALEEFTKMMKDKGLKVQKRMVARLCELMLSIENKTQMALIEKDCFIGISAPEPQYKCISPFTQMEILEIK